METSSTYSQFQPFEITINIQKIEELAVLWACFNASLNDLRNNNSYNNMRKALIDSDIIDKITMQLFELVNEPAKIAGLKR